MKSENITISKSELKNLIREVVDSSLTKHFPKIDYVSDKEQKELEKEFGEFPTIENKEETIKI